MEIIKPKDKVKVDGCIGTVVRVLEDCVGKAIGADVEVAGVVDRYYMDEIRKTNE